MAGGNGRQRTAEAPAEKPAPKAPEKDTDAAGGNGKQRKKT